MDKEAGKLEELAAKIAEWADTCPAIKEVYLFGSRVREDHRPDSDVDIHVKFDYSRNLEDFKKWQEDNDNDFIDLKKNLPGPLSLHQDNDDAVLPDLENGIKKYVFRKVICVETPRKRNG